MLGLFEMRYFKLIKARLPSWKGRTMGDQGKKAEKSQTSSLEEKATIAARQAKRYLMNQEVLVKLEKKRQQERRRARRYAINTELLEVNGIPGNGAKIIDLSTNGARLELPFSPPFMSQMTLKFELQGAKKALSVVGRIIWSKMTLKKGWYLVGVQFYQNYWELDHLLQLPQR
jgi:hypothetical protein